MRPLPSLRQLRYLVALAEHLHFTKAAEACFVTQSTLSAGIRELEAMLGPTLVERDRHSVRLTEVGLRVVQRARELLASAEDLADEAQGLADTLGGLLRLGAIPTIAPFLLPALLKDLRASLPELRVALREDTTANLLDRLRAGQLDVALIALPVDVDGLNVQPLFDDELWVVGPVDDAVLCADGTCVADTFAERLLLLEEGHCLRQHALAACSTKPRLRADGIEATSLLTLMQMVESGIGLALVPEMALRAGLLQSSALAARPLVPAPRRKIALASRRTSARQAETERIAKLLLARHHDEAPLARELLRPANTPRTS